MLAFGEGLCVYRPPVDLKAHRWRCTAPSRTASPRSSLNFITPHQKWGIH